jgi:hypothetical protein
VKKKMSSMVVSNPGTEERYSIKHFCKLFPGRNGRGISRATAMRWMLNGVGGVRLESTKIGGARYTSREAIERFVAALNHRPATVKPIDQGHEAEQIARLLDAEGL